MRAFRSQLAPLVVLACQGIFPSKCIRRAQSRQSDRKRLCDASNFSHKSKERYDYKRANDNPMVDLDRWTIYKTSQALTFGDDLQKKAAVGIKTDWKKTDLKKEREKRSQIENRTCGERRLAEVGVARSQVTLNRAFSFSVILIISAFSCLHQIIFRAEIF